jgi:hypothetical protein
MTMTDYAFRYEQCDIPEGVTIRSWRARNPRPARRRGLRALFSHR